MTQDEIIRMAQEAGFPTYSMNSYEKERLADFAALVAAHEREKQKTKTMRKATRDEKIVRPGVYEVQVEQSSQQPVGVYYGEVEGIGHRVRLDVDLPVGAKLYATKVSIESAVLAEREACAKVCDEVEMRFGRDGDDLEQYGANQCAAAIRARGEA